MSTDSCSKRRRTESPGMEGVYERGNFRDLRSRGNPITDSEIPQSQRYVWFFTVFDYLRLETLNLMLIVMS